MEDKTEEKHSEKDRRAKRPDGPASRNPYLNFLTEFRRGHPDLKPTEGVKKGAEEWNKLSEEMRNKYVAQAFYAPKKSRRAASKRDRSRSRNGSRRDVCDSELSIGSSSNSTCSSTHEFSD